MNESIPFIALKDAITKSAAKGLRVKPRAGQTGLFEDLASAAKEMGSGVIEKFKRFITGKPLPQPSKASQTIANRGRWGNESRKELAARKAELENARNFTLEEVRNKLKGVKSEAGAKVENAKKAIDELRNSTHRQISNIQNRPEIQAARDTVGVHRDQYLGAKNRLRDEILGRNKQLRDGMKNNAIPSAEVDEAINNAINKVNDPMITASKDAVNSFRNQMQDSKKALQKLYKNHSSDIQGISDLMNMRRANQQILSDYQHAPEALDALIANPSLLATGVSPEIVQALTHIDRPLLNQIGEASRTMKGMPNSEPTINALNEYMTLRDAQVEQAKHIAKRLGQIGGGAAGLGGAGYGLWKLKEHYDNQKAQQKEEENLLDRVLTIPGSMY